MPSRVLVNWREMRKHLMEMTEAELNRALEFERTHERRKDFIMRIARRLTIVWGERILKELISEADSDYR